MHAMLYYVCTELTVTSYIASTTLGDYYVSQLSGQEHMLTMV